MLNGGFLKQFERIGRWLKRIENQEIDTVSHYDFMLAYFQNCWALKDWIKNDQALGENIRESIEEEVKKCPNIMICADLANGSKHLVLKDPKEIDGKIEKARIKGIGITIFVGSPDGTEPTRTKQHYNVIGNSGRLGDGLEIAQNAYKEWESLIRKFSRT